MRREHPLWRGFFLALAVTAALLLLHRPDALAAYRLQRRGVAMLCGVAAGAFMFSLPSRLTRRQKHSRSTWQGCLKAFFGGAAMALGVGLIGDGRILSGLAEGSAGAFGFALTALAAGIAAARLVRRRCHA